jgi:hypothetical protein
MTGQRKRGQSCTGLSAIAPRRRTSKPCFRQGPARVLDAPSRRSKAVPVFISWFRPSPFRFPLDHPIEGDLHLAACLGGCEAGVIRLWSPQNKETNDSVDPGDGDGDRRPKKSQVMASGSRADNWSSAPLGFLGKARFARRPSKAQPCTRFALPWLRI